MLERPRPSPPAPKLCQQGTGMPAVSSPSRPCQRHKNACAAPGPAAAIHCQGHPSSHPPAVPQRFFPGSRCEEIPAAAADSPPRTSGRATPSAPNPNILVRSQPPAAPDPPPQSHQLTTGNWQKAPNHLEGSWVFRPGQRCHAQPVGELHLTKLG